MFQSFIYIYCIGLRWVFGPENILAMRAAKLMNYVEAAQWAPHVEFVRYEDLLSEGGEGARRYGIHWLLPPTLPQACTCDKGLD